jgi:hypothetical protein
MRPIAVYESIKKSPPLARAMKPRASISSSAQAEASPY